MHIKAVLFKWGQKFAKWAPDMAVVMYDGSPDERKQLQKEQVEKGTFNVLITHYDLVMRDKTALRKVGTASPLYVLLASRVLSQGAEMCHTCLIWHNMFQVFVCAAHLPDLL